jgi:hypothetical protein
MRAMTTLLLDRNIVIAIDDQLSGRSHAHAAQLAKLDHPRYTVSSLLSVLETHRASTRDAAAIAESIDREARLLKRFFRRARTDSALLLAERDTMAVTFANELAREHDRDMQFIAALQRRLSDQNGREEAVRAFLALTQFIAAYGRQLGDPAVLAGLACTLGCLDARSVLKPTPEPTPNDTFNALADIEKIRLTNYIRHLSIGEGHGGDVHLETFDRGLNALSRTIRVTDSVSVQTAGAGYETVSYAFDRDVYFGRMPFLRGQPKRVERLKALLDNA